jgi:hypothetical protein
LLNLVIALAPLLPLTVSRYLGFDTIPSSPFQVKTFGFLVIVGLDIWIWIMNSAAKSPL